jgi:hypothetical protein
MSLVDRLRDVVYGPNDDFLEGDLAKRGSRSLRKAKVAGKKAQRKVQNFTQAKINQLQDAIKSRSGKIPFGPETPGVRGFKNAAGYAANPLIQSTFYAPFILGGMETARDALRSDRGRAFTQNISAGRYGDAARHLAGDYQYNYGIEVPVNLDGMLAPLEKEPSVEALKALIVKNPSLLNKVATEEEASMVPSNGPSRQPKTTPGLQPGINPRTGLPYTISPGKPGFEPGTEISDSNRQPSVSKTERLAQERETVGLTPMQQWAMANKGLAQKVGENQSGYDEIQAYFEAQDTQRTPMDQLAINRGGLSTVIDGGEMTSTPLTPLAGRNTQAPAGDFPQYGTQMSGSNPFASIALPGTAEGLSQIAFPAGQVQMPESMSKINIDDFYGIDRFLPFPNIEAEPELNRITNIIRRKK